MRKNEIDSSKTKYDDEGVKTVQNFSAGRN
jgi:hypothetical protein